MSVSSFNLSVTWALLTGKLPLYLLLIFCGAVQWRWWSLPLFPLKLVFSWRSYCRAVLSIGDTKYYDEYFRDFPENKNGLKALAEHHIEIWAKQVIMDQRLEDPPKTKMDPAKEIKKIYDAALLLRLIGSTGYGPYYRRAELKVDRFLTAIAN